jgi:dihydroorotate dehydrogenase
MAVITLSNNHQFQYMAASGALAFDGKGWPWEHPLRWCGLLDPRLFTVVIKTLTRYPTRGNLRWWNPWRCVRVIEDGVVNAVALTNHGVEWWCRKIGPKVSESSIPLVGSILSDNVRELAAMASMLDDFQLVGIEYNASCPNTEHHSMQNADLVVRGCEAIRDATLHPIILKISVVHDVQRIVPRVRGLVEALSINSVPWHIVFPGRRSPLARFGGGGVSGYPARLYTWDMTRRLAYMSDIPVIGPSIWHYGDIDYVLQWAKAVSFGSIFLRYPWRPTAYVRRHVRERVATHQG